MTKPQLTKSLKLSPLPSKPGVYYFLAPERSILYIGKATNLRTRVKSYFDINIGEKRSPLIAKMIDEASSIKFEETDSVLEALILEAELIKKHLPTYNTMGKDQKSWNYVVITDEEFPRVLVMRERDLVFSIGGEVKTQEKFSPFPHGGELKEAMKIIRRIFPYRDKCIVSPYQGEAREHLGVGCFNYQIGLCPGPCAGVITPKEYAKTIKNISLFFKGKKKDLVKNLAKEMKALAGERKFEEADKIKSQIFALQHINDIALIKSKNPHPNYSLPTTRIEAYDIAHTSGSEVVGVMTVVELDGENTEAYLKKSDYRKFKILQNKNDDVGNLRELIKRRLKHNEWPYPQLIVVDGGLAQINAARIELENSGLNLNISVLGVVKDRHHKAREILTTKEEDRSLAGNYKKEIILANSEAHRFAITFHRKRRNKGFLP